MASSFLSVFACWGWPILQQRAGIQRLRQSSLFCNKVWPQVARENHCTCMKIDMIEILLDVFWTMLNLQQATLQLWHPLHKQWEPFASSPWAAGEFDIGIHRLTRLTFEAVSEIFCFHWGFSSNMMPTQTEFWSLQRFTSLQATSLSPLAFRLTKRDWKNAPLFAKFVRMATYLMYAQLDLFCYIYFLNLVVLIDLIDMSDINRPQFLFFILDWAHQQKHIWSVLKKLSRLGHSEQQRWRCAFVGRLV